MRERKEKVGEEDQEEGGEYCMCIRYVRHIHRHTGRGRVVRGRGRENGNDGTDWNGSWGGK